PACQAATAADHQPRSITPPACAKPRALLDDDTLELAARVAGCVVLLYGQRVTRIVTLRSDDLDLRGPQVLLKLGQDPIELPDPPPPDRHRSGGSPLALRASLRPARTTPRQRRLEGAFRRLVSVSAPYARARASSRAGSPGAQLRRRSRSSWAGRSRQRLRRS